MHVDKYNGLYIDARLISLQGKLLKKLRTIAWSFTVIKEERLYGRPGLVRPRGMFGSGYI